MAHKLLLNDRKNDLRLLVICLASILLNVASFAEQQGTLSKVKILRLQGNLPDAQSLAEQQLEQNVADRHLAISFHLELARIHDRIGLHHNTRPVLAALAHIDMAASLVTRVDTAALAEIELARADYFYRAEMSAREFPRSIQYAHSAITQFQNIADQQGEADATHRLGLIYMQRGDLRKAMELFEKALHVRVQGIEHPARSARGRDELDESSRPRRLGMQRVQLGDLLCAEPPNPVPDGAGPDQLQIVGAGEQLELSPGLVQGDSPIHEPRFVGRSDHALGTHEVPSQGCGPTLSTRLLCSRIQPGSGPRSSRLCARWINQRPGRSRSKLA